MRPRLGGIFYALAMVAIVAGLDVLFLRHRFWDRLLMNIGVVVVFGAVYFRFTTRR